MFWDKNDLNLMQNPVRLTLVQKMCLITIHLSEMHYGLYQRPSLQVVSNVGGNMQVYSLSWHSCDAVMLSENKPCGR